jgi:hypothetical protein
MMKAQHIQQPSLAFGIGLVQDGLAMEKKGIWFIPSLPSYPFFLPAQS